MHSGQVLPGTEQGNPKHWRIGGKGGRRVIQTNYTFRFLLALISHQVAVNPLQLLHHVDNQGGFGEMEILTTAKLLTPKAKALDWPKHRHAMLPTPAIARMANGEYILVSRVHDHDVD